MENTKILANHIQTSHGFDILNFRKIGMFEFKDIFNIDLENFPYDSNKPLVISGPLSVWAYLYIYQRLNNLGIKRVLYYDIHYGAIDLNALFKKEIGQQIDKDLIDPYIRGDLKRTSHISIALLGPPHRGKSVFVHRFHKLLNEKYPLFASDHFYLIKGCPDGEGLWSGYIPEERAKILKYKDFKNSFTDEFIDDVIDQIKEIGKLKSLLFVDCGGKIDDKNKRLVEKCSHALFFYNNVEELKEWHSAFIHEGTNTSLLANIKSVMGDTYEPSCQKNGDVFELQLCNLTRENQHVLIPDEFIDYLVKS